MTCGKCLANYESFLEIPSGYIWLYNIAMENGSFIDFYFFLMMFCDELPIKNMTLQFYA